MRYRLAKMADLPTCRELLNPGFRTTASVRRNVLGVWEKLIANNAMNMTVIEDVTRPHPDCIEAFGSSFFATEDFITEFCAAPKPYLAAIIYERILTGRSPLLSAPQIISENSSRGLHLVVPHFGLRNPDLSNERTLRALQAASSAFYFFHAGYRINSILNEVYGGQHARYMEAGGFRLLSNFEDRLTPEIVGVPAKHQPYLFMLKKDWIAPAAVNPLWFLFHALPPQMHFSPAEQRVLVHALFNEPDVEIAENLSVSLDAVKKAWRNIYNRVALAAPYLIENTERLSSTGRGSEKRRYLLEYLRTHPEELRPFSKSAQGSR